MIRYKWALIVDRNLETFSVNLEWYLCYYDIGVHSELHFLNIEMSESSIQKPKSKIVISWLNQRTLTNQAIDILIS